MVIDCLREFPPHRPKRPFYRNRLYNCHNVRQRFRGTMQTEIPVSEDSTLASVRRRSQSYLGYLFWVLLGLCFLWASNTVASLVERWVAMLYGMRRAAGLEAPVAGPDYWILGGVAVLALVTLAAIVGAYAAYRAAWSRRLRTVWSTPPESSHVQIRRLRGCADNAALQQ